MNITEFLDARITEDEELANAALNGRHGKHETDWDYGGYVLGAERDATPKQDEFITTWWPARVLAECAAKRKIITEHSPVDPCDAHDAEFKTVTCDTIRTLAAVYKDHPDYQEEWAA